MSGAIAAWFDDALACLACEHPVSYVAMEHAFGERRFEIEIEDEHFLLELGASAPHGPIVSVATDLDTLWGLVHGEEPALDAILAGRLDVVAGPDDLIATARAMDHLLQGALRCISMQALLDRLDELRKERR